MDALEQVIRERYDLGALSATTAGAAFYVRRGWQPWRGRLFAVTPNGPVRA